MRHIKKMDEMIGRRTPDERIEMNVEFLEKIANFCTEHKLSSPELEGGTGIFSPSNDAPATRWCHIEANDGLWEQLKSELLSDTRYYQKRPYADYIDPQIRLRGDRQGNENARVSIGYAWEDKGDGKHHPAYAGSFELVIDNTRGFIWNNVWHDRIEELLKRICDDVKL